MVCHHHSRSVTYSSLRVQVSQHRDDDASTLVVRLSRREGRRAYPWRIPGRRIPSTDCQRSRGDTNPSLAGYGTPLLEQSFGLYRPFTDPRSLEVEVGCPRSTRREGSLMAPSHPSTVPVYAANTLRLTPLSEIRLSPSVGYGLLRLMQVPTMSLRTLADDDRKNSPEITAELFC